MSYAGYKIIAIARMIAKNIIQGKQPENIWYKALNASNIILFFITIIDIITALSALFSNHSLRLGCSEVGHVGG